jgi:nicotinamidase-related amidase
MIKDKKIAEHVPDRAKTALLIIDIVNDFEYPDGDKLLEQAEKMAPALAELKKKARRAGIPAIYINDNFGKWQQDFKTTLKHCLRPAAKGKTFVAKLKPDAKDYYILKPQRSAFYHTTLDLLLESMEAESLIITGLTTDICILFSANDAYMRNYELFVPRDCVCARTRKINTDSLKFIADNLKADTRASVKLDLKSR